MQTRQMKRSKKYKKYKRTRGIVFIILLLMIVVTSGFTSGKIYIDNNVEIETFYPGISIDGISLEGMNKDQAVRELALANTQRLEAYNIRLKYKDAEWSLDYDDIGGKLNIQELVQEAYLIGRQGNIINRIRRIWDLKTNNVEYSSDFTYSVDKLKAEIQEIANTINQEPIEATISFNPDAEEKFIITPEKTGCKLDVDSIVQQIQISLEENYKVIVELEPNEIKPLLTAETLKNQTHMIASFSTDLGDSSQERIHNVFLSNKQFNGMVIQPGQIVSFNETTGQRTKANGYKAAPVIKPDKSLGNDLGGGVCQTSSTIYNAVLYAGLEIVERTHHSFPSTYVDKGMDATVDWPSVDLKFKNNKDTPVYLRTYNSENKIFVEVYGQPLPNNREIKLETDVYQTYAAPKPRIEVDKNQRYVTYKDQTYEKVKSRPGYKVKSYRIVYEDGKEVSRELLANDFYRPITGVIYAGVKPRPNNKDNNDNSTANNNTNDNMTNNTNDNTNNNADNNNISNE